MNRPAPRLYELLPVVHRMRDAAHGYPLRALLDVIGEQVDLVEDDIEALYDNWFIETCEDWIVPYIADLIGYRPVHEAGGSSGAAFLETRERNKVVVPRREVANTLRSRRRKGTLALLELLAGDVAGWPARAVEWYTRIGWTQHVNHLRMRRGRTVNVRDGDLLDLLDSPLDAIAHGVDVRRPISHRGTGRHNIPGAAVFVWRLKSYSVTHAPANCVESAGPHCYAFSVLGNDTPLYIGPETDEEPTHVAREINLPARIRRRALEERVTVRPLVTRAAAAYYGADKSVALYAPDWPVKGAPQPVSREVVIPADLSGWHYRAPRNRVALDPALGRLVFPTGQLPKRGVWVTYHYAFSADIGGGEYDRSLWQPMDFMLYRVRRDDPEPGTFDTIHRALSQWRADQQALPPQPEGDDERASWEKDKERLRSAVIEIEDSAAYTEPLAIALDSGESLQIRAATRTRPAIRMLDYMTDRPDAFTVSGKKGSRFKIDGLLISGRGMQVTGPDRADSERYAEGDLCDVTIRHCTLVPGWAVEGDCEPKRPNEPSLELIDTTAKVVIDHSIIGSIYVTADEVQTDPLDIAINDSIVDATSLERVAVGAPNLPLAFVRMTIVRSTVIGEVHAHAIALAENSIFTSRIRVGRRQYGCVRFSFVTPGSRTPRRYHCQPDLVVAGLDEMQPPLTPEQKNREKERETRRVRPRFNSMRYGNPTYCQLAFDCADEITRGADDESEMGVFHDLFQPQRKANLRARLDEYTPAGIETGIVFAN